MSNDRVTHSVRMFLSAEHDCAYYPERTAQNAVLDPSFDDQKWLYDFAITQGFRRAGAHIFRPRCAACSACQSSRIRVKEFQANRSQRKLMNKNRDLSVHVERARYTEEYFALYTRYIHARHANSGMDDSNPEDFSRFLMSPWSRQEFIELRLQDRLVALAITDVTSTGLSAVYTCFEPELPERSLGVMAILSQIERSKTLGLPFLYLGFWLQGHPKMDYKRRYSAFEFLRDRVWVCES